MSSEQNRITTYEQLLAERRRLETLIINQKNIVRHDLDELKAEFRKEIRPAIDAANFFKKFVNTGPRRETVQSLLAGVAFDIVFTGLLGKSNIVLRTFLPRILKSVAVEFLVRNRQAPSKPKANSYTPEW